MFDETEINNVVTNLISNNKIKIVNDFQYKSLDLDNVGYLETNQVPNKNRYRIR